MIFRRRSQLLPWACLLILGCAPGVEDTSKERLEKMAGGALKEVVPVSGKVLVDGAAKAGVNLLLYPSAGGKPVGNARSGADGTYCWSTYTPCDGLAAGSYVVAFKLIPKPKRNDREEKGADGFKGRYSDPLKSEFKLTVEKGKPQTNVDYELKSK